MIRERKRKKEKGWTWKEGSPLLLPPSSIIARHCAKAKHLLLGKLWEQVCECVSALPSTSLSHSHHSMKLETERKKERKREPKSSSLVLQRQQQQQLSTAVKFDAVKCALWVHWNDGRRRRFVPLRRSNERLVLPFFSYFSPFSPFLRFPPFCNRRLLIRLK